MQHKNCGGSMIRVLKTKIKSVYQCNRCRKILTVYSRTAPVAIQIIENRGDNGK